MDTTPPSLDSGIEPGEPGELDVSFGEAGLVTLDVPEATGLYSGIVDMVSIGGRLVAVCNPRFGAGDDIKATLVRFELDGSLDTSFGDGGFARLDPGGDIDVVAEELAVDSRGRLVVAAFISNDIGGTFFGAVRTGPDGDLDLSFGADGFFQYQFGPEENHTFAMAVAEDDSVILGGNYGPPGSAGVKQWALARVAASGALDPSFGDGGSLLIDIRMAGSGSGNVAELVAIPGGGFLAAGPFVNFDADGGDSLALLARMTDDGSFDSGFGVDGRVDLEGFEGSRQSMARSDAGRVHVWVDSLVVEGRAADGSLDGGWGEGGQASLMQAGATMNADPGGRVYVAGRAFASGMTEDAQIVRLGADGALDSDFGVPSVGVDGSQMAPLAVDFLADDRVVMGGGFTRTGGQAGLFLARFWP